MEYKIHKKQNQKTQYQLGREIFWYLIFTIILRLNFIPVFMQNWANTHHKRTSQTDAKNNWYVLCTVALQYKIRNVMTEDCG